MLKNSLIGKFYLAVFQISFITYIMRQAFPMHDIFWIVWGLLQLTGLYVLLKNIRKIDIKAVISFILINKTFVILFVGYIVIDLFNMSYGPEPILALGKYIVFIEGLSYLVHAGLIHEIYKIENQNFLNISYFCITISAFVTAILAIVNYVYPFIPGGQTGQISVIGDYNAFCRYFLFSFLVGFIYLYNAITDIYRRLLSLVIFAIPVCCVMIMSTSRRTLLTLLFFTAVLVVYYFANTKKEYLKYGLKKYTQYLIISALTVCLSVTAVEKISEGVFLYKASLENNKVSVGSELNQENENTSSESMLEEPSGIDEDKTDSPTEQDIVPDIDDKTEEKNDIQVGGVKQTISRIEADNFWGKRAVIWNEAVNEIQDYNLLEILIGRGAGYATYFYEQEPTSDVIAELYGVESLPASSMHTHNYLLQDFMEGGILKLFFSLSLTLGLGIKILINLIKNGRQWVIPLLSLILIATNIMISYSSGFIGDTYYNLTLLFILEIKQIEKQKNLKDQIYG